MKVRFCFQTRGREAQGEGNTGISHCSTCFRSISRDDEIAVIHMVEVPVWRSQSFLKPKVAPSCSAAVRQGLLYPDEVFTVSVSFKVLEEDRE